jgi:hypothetical protein
MRRLSRGSEIVKSRSFYISCMLAVVLWLPRERRLDELQCNPLPPARVLPKGILLINQRQVRSKLFKNLTLLNLVKQTWLIHFSAQRDKTEMDCRLC